MVPEHQFGPHQPVLTGTFQSEYFQSRKIFEKS